MKRIALGLLIAAIALTTTVLVALAANGSGAPVDTSGGDAPLKPAAATYAYLGVVVANLSEEEAAALGVSGGVVVKAVLEGEASEGLLQVDDVITAVDGEAVKSVTELREKVRARAPGDTIRLSVLRSGSAIQVDVTLGESRPALALHTFLMPKRLDGALLDLFPRDPDAFVRAEVVTEDGNGEYVTVTAVAGAIVSVDVAAGTLVLEAKDGSGQVTYAITGDTTILASGGLAAENKAIVVSKNGEAQMVVQGEFFDRLRPGPFGHRFAFPRIEQRLLLPELRLEGDLRDRLDMFLEDHELDSIFEGGLVHPLGVDCRREESGDESNKTVIITCTSKVESP